MSSTTLGRKVAVEAKLDDSSTSSEDKVSIPTTWMHGKEVHAAQLDLPTVNVRDNGLFAQSCVSFCDSACVF